MIERACQYWSPILLNFRALSSLTFISFFLLGSPAFAKNPPKVPRKWSRLVELDQSKNVDSRKGEILSEAEQVSRAVYHWDIPAEQVDHLESKYITDAEKGFATVVKQGRKYVRVFILNQADMPFEDMKSRFGEPVQQYWAKKLQSHSTYFVWDPSNPSEVPYFLKMQSDKSKDGKEDIVNRWSQCEWAIEKNDVVEGLLRDSPDPRATLFPERFAAGVKSVQYAYSLRSVMPIGEARFPDSEILPLHGFLGSAELIEDTAQKMKMSSDQWIETVYFKRLAEFLVKMNYGYGLFLEAHTQNLLVIMNKKSGDILGFVSRDMMDIMLDSAAPFAKGRKLHLESLKKYGLTAVNYEFLDSERREAKKIGVHFEEYVAQSVYSFEPSFRAKNRLAKVFLREFVRAVETFTGETLLLSSGLHRELWSDESKALERFDLVRFVTQEIYDQVSNSRLPQLPETAFQYDQTELTRLFNAKHELNNSFWVRDLEGSAVKMGMYRVAFHNGGIYLVNLQGQVLGVAHSLTPKDFKKIRDIKIERGTAPKATCEMQFAS